MAGRTPDSFKSGATSANALFRFFPCPERDSGEPAVLRSMLAGMSGKVSAISVGVVEDDASLCRSMARFPRAAGLQVSSFLSAEAFLGSASHSRFDCLLLDIQLGGMSGIELAERLAGAGNAPPIIFITAHDEPEIRARAFAAGCVAYLNKSDPGDAMLSAIRQACEPKNHRPAPQALGAEIP